MNKLEQLIKEFCPDGILYKQIEEVVLSISTGLNPRKNFVLNATGADCYYVTVKEMASGTIKFTDKTDKITQDAVAIIQMRSKLAVGDLLLSGIGTIGRVALVDMPVDNWNCSESVTVIKPNSDIINSKFLLYVLRSEKSQKYFNENATGSTLKGIRKKDLLTLKLPVPPLPVQEEIVRILDELTEKTDKLISELNAELDERKKQYEYYKRQILLFDTPDTQWVTLGDIGKVSMCKRIMKSETSPNGDIPFYKIGTFGGQANAYISKETFEAYKEKYSYPKKGDILISAAGTIGRTVIFDGQPAYFQDSNIVWIANDESKLLNCFLNYYYQTQPWQISTGGTISRLYNDNISSAKIPLISKEEQLKIVSIMEKCETVFSNYTNSIKEEITTRKQQHEYYRDKLLMF